MCLPGENDQFWLDELAERVLYVGSGHHKRSPADYGLERTQPRPTKSLCDKQRTISFDEAKGMLKQGAHCGMISSLRYGEFPKYIWFVAEDYQVFEAKTDQSAPGQYHGYPLEPNDSFRDIVLKAWKEQKPKH